MSVALGLLLIAQLNSFEFTEITSPQYAGDSFQITIVARDQYGGIYPFNGSALLSTTKDDIWTYVVPTVVPFANGVFAGYVTITLAESLALRCVEPQNLVSGTSNEFEVFSGTPDRFIIILPGEELAPGSEEGRLPTLPDPVSAGEQFDLTVHVTDAWHNVVEFREDSVYLASSDSFGNVPRAGVLSNGTGRFSVALNSAGEHRFYATPAGGSPVSPDTSSKITVLPGEFSQLLVLLPGETHLPGDNAIEPWQTPGKSGEPATQYAGTLFKVVVYACDESWNRVRGNGDSIVLGSDFSFEPSPEMVALEDSAVFRVSYQYPGDNQNIWATAPGTAIHASYRSYFDVRALGRHLEVDVTDIRGEPADTTRAGDTAYIHVTVTDDNREPIVTEVVKFSVVAGGGRLYDRAMLTDTLGKVTARYLTKADRGAEFDTILISSGADTLVEIYVDRTDTLPIIAFPNPFGFNQEQTTIEYYLQRSGSVRFAIYDPFGNEVRVWDFAAGQQGALPGTNRVIWDGRNARGRRVANGIYIVKIIGELHTGTTFSDAFRVGVAW